MSSKPSEIIVYDSMLHSNLKPQEKSMIASWFDKASAGLSATRNANTGITKSHVLHAAQVVRQTLESNPIAFGLGVLHADIGLDFFGVPSDLVAGLGLTGTSLILGNYEVSTDIQNMANACNNSYAFRKGYDWMAAKKKAKGVEPAGKFGVSTMHGEESDDPIKDVAKKL